MKNTQEMKHSKYHRTEDGGKHLWVSEVARTPKRTPSNRQLNKTIVALMLKMVLKMFYAYNKNGKQQQ